MLEFLYPWGLTSLAALGGILFLYFYVFRGKRIPVSALFLWEATRSLKREGQKRRRPPLTLPLLLELLAALLLGLIVAGLVYTHVTSRPHLVVLLDSSASMNAGSGEETFRAQAAERIVALCRSLGRDARVSIVETGFGGRILGGEPLSTARAAALLEDWRPTAPPHSPRQAIELGRSLLGEEGRMVLVTDHRTERGDITVIGVGEPLSNTGWAAARWMAGNRIFALTQHFGDAAPQKSVTLYAGDRELTRKEVDFSERAAVPLVFTVPEGVDSVRIELPPDALANDNVVRLSRPPQPTLNVQVAVGHGGLEERLQRALRACRRVQPRVAEPPALVFDAGGEPTAGAARALLLVSFRRPATERARAYVGPFFVDPFSSLTRGVDLKGAVWTADPEFPAEQGRVLASAGEVPLVVRRGDRVLVNMAPEESTVFQMPAWPVLISNLVEHAYEQSPGLKRFSFRLGESLSFRRPRDWQGRIVVEEPGGGRIAFDENHVFYGNLAREGIYRVLASGEPVLSFDVNLLAPEESDLTAAASFDDAGALDAASLRTARSRGFHREFALVAAALLLGCWFLLERQRA